MENPWDRIKVSGTDRPPLVSLKKKKRAKPAAEKSAGLEAGIFIIELGLNPRVVYTRPAVGPERKAVHSEENPSAPDVYDTISYFIYPYEKWLEKDTEMTGKCSCMGFRIRLSCKHLPEAQKIAEPYKHLLQTTTIYTPTSQE